jgi:hypothetical protein
MNKASFMVKRVQIGERVGSFGQNKDSWYFVVADDGKQYVEHEWSNAGGTGNKGTKSIPVDEFLSGDYLYRQHQRRLFAKWLRPGRPRCQSRGEQNRQFQPHRHRRTAVRSLG